MMIYLCFGTNATILNKDILHFLFFIHDTYCDCKITQQSKSPIDSTSQLISVRGAVDSYVVRVQEAENGRRSNHEKMIISVSELS